MLLNKQRTRLISFPGGKAGEYTIPASVSSMNECAFADCNGLTSVSIPANVSSIAWFAFSRCKRLADVRIHEGVGKIEGHAFSGCDNLVSIALPRSISSIGVCPFCNCNALTTIDVDAANPSYSSRDGVLFNKQGTRLIQCPGGKAGHYSVPDSVSCIEEGAFSCCSRLTAITLPASVTSIASNVFASCSGLTAVFCEGNAPNGGSDQFVFGRVYRLQVIYRRSGTKGWGETFGGRPVKVWDPANPPQIDTTVPVATPALPRSFQRSSTATRALSPVTLKVGDPAPALAQGKYVQGEPLAAFEKGKVYVVEFWATWCGPCRRVIPHINALQAKHKSRGLVVIGQNVWQRGENVEKDVTDFVKQMGADMGYRVALDRDGAMAETWMRAAGRGGIPCAFVVDKDGKVAWIGHPMSGLDEAVEKLLPGKSATEQGVPSPQAQTGGAPLAAQPAPAQEAVTLAEAVRRHQVAARSAPAQAVVTQPRRSGSTRSSCTPSSLMRRAPSPFTLRSAGYSFVTNVDGLATITGFSGDFGSELIIPAKLGGRQVIEIGRSAFENCGGLLRVSIPASVTNVGASAFSNCPNLSDVRFEGDAPTVDRKKQIFSGTLNATVYFRSGTKGWGPTFGGRPTKEWKP